jgi:O-antigen/teichoic acid export membrane protein
MGIASVFKNTFALLVPNLLNPLISFLLIVFISRYLGVGELGQYSLVLSYLSLAGIFSSMGLTTLLVRQISRRPEEAHVLVSNASIFGAFSSLASVLAMNLAVVLVGYDREVIQAALVCSFSLLISTPISYLEGVFRSFEKSQYIAFAYVTENLLRVGTCILLLRSGSGIVALFAVSVACRVFALMLMLYLYRRTVGRIDFQIRKDVLQLFRKEAPTFASIAFFSTIYLGTDQIILSKLKGMVSVGIYSAADRLLQITKTLPLAFGAALLPILTREFAAGLRQLQALTILGIRYLFLGLAPIIVGTAILSTSIIATIYGDKFATAAAILQLHIFSLLPTGIALLLAEVLIASDNQRIDLRINVGAAIVNVGLNFLFISLFSAWGAALATLVTMTLFCMVQYGYIRKYLFCIPVTRVAGKSIIASVSMGMFTHMFKEWNLFGNIAISSIIYIVLIIVLRLISTEELYILKRIFNNIFGINSIY